MKTEIYEDIEAIVQWTLENTTAGSEEGRAALRIEAYLATYKPKDL